MANNARNSGISGWNLMSRIDAKTDKFADSKDRPRSWNRFMGGRRRTNHPYISGYWYFFLEPPKYIFGDNSKEATSWWFSTAEGFTPHSTNLMKVDVPGMGGQASSFVAGRDITRNFSVTFREYQNLPILNYITMWSSAINDPNLGLSIMQGNEYIPMNYKGAAWVALCKPTIGDPGGDHLLKPEDIEVLWHYDGVFPEGIPTDTFASDISASDTTQLNISFSFDGYPLNGKNEVSVMSQFIDNIQNTYSNDPMDSLHNHLTTSAADGGAEGGNNKNNVEF